ncbi:MAG: serine hydrolase [Lewinella sp.]|nr:serine hydrolase [Lewinella sp.]
MRVTFLLLSLSLSLSLLAQSEYVPPRQGEWATVSPAAAGFDATKLAQAVDFAETHEYSGARDLRIAILEGFAREPFHGLAGPVKERGGPAGLILKGGKIVAQWGDVRRVDMTFSVTKSYLSTVAGLAMDEGLIADVHDPVGDYVWDGTFDGAHNSGITWDHLLTQTSDWSGELWGMRDWADRPPREGGLDDWRYRELREPGTFFEYNDVRVNVLAYSLLQVWRRPLPQILKERIMDPIGASTTWRWYGYEHSFTLVDGMRMQSVSGGGHSGGGLFINTLDHARFGLLFLRQGRWAEEQLLSPDWIAAARQPAAANPNYGYMWWLNEAEGERHWPGVPESVYYAAGFGGNFIVVDETHDLVIVTRWLEPREIGEMVKLVLEALEE